MKNYIIRLSLSVPIAATFLIFAHLASALSLGDIEAALHRLYGPDASIEKIKAARPGDTGTGAVVRRAGDELDIDTTPCERRHIIMTFVRPFAEDNADPAHCSTNTVPQKTVTQQ